MVDRLLYARGALRPITEAESSREADVLATREGVFETLLVADGVARDAGAHVGRLLGAAGSLGLVVAESRAQLLDAVRAVASTTSTPWSRLRITLFGSGSEVEALVTTAAYIQPSPSTYARGVQVSLARDARVLRADETRQVKSLAWRRQGALLLDAVPGCYDVMLLNDAGRLAEGARTNVVVRRRGVAVTPPLSEGCLPGTVRGRLLESGAVCEGELDVADVLSGGEVVVTNSLIGVLPVARIDDLRCEVWGLAGELAAALEVTRPW